MKILVLNRGSSSIKCSLFSDEELLWQTHVEGEENFTKLEIKSYNHQGGSYSEKIHVSSPGDAIKKIISVLIESQAAILHSLSEVDAVCHRIVHGGKKYSSSILINTEVKKEIKELSELAPLHNQADLEGIEILEKLFPGKPQVAVFDTAFHRTMPIDAVVYPGPYHWFEEDIQRYGFHGISFQYCTKKAAEILKKLPSKMIICHLGSGASLCAVKEGKSIDTTMGFTPLEGLMMDTRSGTVDPGILLHLLQKKKKTADEISQDLNKHSGLLGISGVSSDMRDILEQTKNPRCKLAFDVYVHRLNALMGSMIASLQGLEAIVFTAGIGENAHLIRKKVCDSFSFLGVKLDEKKNESMPKEDLVLSLEDSQVKILLVHTNEALEMARECVKTLK